MAAIQKKSRKRDSAREELGRLTLKLESKVKQLQLLELEHSSLKFQHDLMAAFADTLGWIRDEHHQQQQLEQQRHPLLAENELVHAREELLLLEQLHSIPYVDQPMFVASNGYLTLGAHTPSLIAAVRSAGIAPPAEMLTAAVAAASSDSSEGPLQDRHATSCSSADLEPERIAPPDDMLYLLKWLLQQPPLHGFESLNLLGMQANYAQTVKEASLLLHQIESGIPDTLRYADVLDKVWPTDQLKDVMLQHCRLIMTLALMSSNSKMLTKFSLANLVTGEEVPEHNRELYRCVIAKLGLTLRQMQDIAGGYKVFMKMYTPVMQELRQLQLQMGADACGNNLNNYNRSSRCSHEGDSEDSAAASRLSEESILQQLMQTRLHKQRLDRLRVLMGKDAFVQVFLMVQVAGCLSWVQLAKLFVHMSPYPVRWCALASMISEELQQVIIQQQLLLQQQEQPALQQQQQQLLPGGK